MKPNENNETIVDTSNITHDDLLDAYDKIAQKYREIKMENDHLNQKLHSEISQKKVAENILNDLQCELDSINDVHAKEFSQIEKNCEEYKIKNQALIMGRIALENKVDELSAQIHVLNEDLKELKGLLAVKTIKPRVSDTYAKSLEIENDTLRATINEMKEELEELSVKYSHSVGQYEEIKERYECVQDNFESKKIELEEKTEVMEQIQEKVHELSTELSLLKNSGPDDENRKGNSLFAELDDQRQKMKKILQAERVHYLEMKKAYNSREMEIRRLKRENLNIKSEIQACSNQLKRGEQLISNQMKIFVSNLESEKHKLEVELKKMEGKLIDLARDQKMHWVETVITSASKEARDLKDKHYVLLREKTSLADKHSAMLKELARARLNSIKLKVLLGRIVDEFKIKIDESQYSDLGIDECVFENLKLEDYETFDATSSFDMSLKMEEDEKYEMSGILNESTIILLGGREKLGNAIPCAMEKIENFSSKIENINSGNECSTEAKSDNHSVVQIKEEKIEVIEDICKNSAIIDTEKENSIFRKPVSSPAKPVEKQSELQLPLKAKSIQFSNKDQTKIIDSTKEEFEQSREARKRPAFTIKRIVIPSKTPKTS